MMSRIVSSAKMEESFSSSSNIHILQHGNFPDFWLKIHQNYLVGGFNPSEKYARQIGSCPQGSGGAKSSRLENINKQIHGKKTSVPLRLPNALAPRPGPPGHVQQHVARLASALPLSWVQPPRVKKAGESTWISTEFSSKEYTLKSVELEPCCLYSS